MGPNTAADQLNHVKAYLLCRSADSNQLYSSWSQRLSFPCEVVRDYLPDWQPPADAGILVTHLHYSWENLAALRRLYQQNTIPILILCDGILEYRNTWHHPQLPDGCMMQPAIGHKLACIGRAPARILESWGNVGKCEVVGLPHLDRLLQSTPPPVSREGAFRLLIATARTPAFDPAQRKVLLDSLLALKTYLSRQGQISGRSVQVFWRLSGGLNEDLGIESADSGEGPAISMAEQIDQSDAVIITPSTGYLECLIRGRPTAILDFHNTPSYLNPAWTISAESHFGQVIEELANPPAPKMLHQSQTLHDQLECLTPATDRMVSLVEGMVAQHMVSIQRGEPLAFPQRMLADERSGFAPMSAEFDLSQLYPNNPVFQNSDVRLLQIELSAAINRLDTLPARLTELQNQLQQTIQALENSKQRNREIHLRLVRLKKRFGIEPKFDIE